LTATRSFRRARCAREFRRGAPKHPREFWRGRRGRGINVRRFEAGSGARNILGHGFFGPGETDGANENGQRERNSGAGATLAICGPGRDSRGEFQLQRDLVSRATACFHAHNARRSFRRNSGGGCGVERKNDPDARTCFAGFVTLHANAVARNVERVTGFHAHAQRATPANACGKSQLRARLFAQLQESRRQIHERLS
jgi:hypothetical protein